MTNFKLVNALARYPTKTKMMNIHANHHHVSIVIVSMLACWR